jgi:hypothetical protein
VLHRSHRLPASLSLLSPHTKSISNCETLPPSFESEIRKFVLSSSTNRAVSATCTSNTRISDLIDASARLTGMRAVVVKIEGGGTLSFSSCCCDDSAAVVLFT